MGKAVSFLPKLKRAYLGMGQSAFICVTESGGFWRGVSVRTETLWMEGDLSHAIIIRIH